MLEVFEYNYKPQAAIAPWEAEAITRGSPTTLDIGLTRNPDPSLIPSTDTLLQLSGPRRILALEDGELYVVEARTESGYYKLVPVSPGAPPTLEINGIHMHRVKDTDPLRDTLSKVRAARIGRGHRVLDVCTGLGYTAIASARRGASLVHTVEVDEYVLWIAERNPWSRGLGDPRITIILGDAVEVLGELPLEFYDRIIHDPPRLTPSTGDLYSQNFYQLLYKLLKPGGILFHYTGEPGRIRGLNVPGSVASRLRRAGFEVIGYDDRALGVVARKPK